MGGSDQTSMLFVHLSGTGCFENKESPIAKRGIPAGEKRSPAPTV